jgi:hypothetical protein
MQERAVNLAPPHAILVIRPRVVLVSDSRWRGVNPAHEHNASADRNRPTSPISATRTAAMVRPTPLIA